MARLIILLCLLCSATSCQTNDQDALFLAMIHMAPVLANSVEDIATNAQTIASAMKEAKERGADWVMTPELALTGYKFTQKIGIDWIEPGVDKWVVQLQNTAKDLNMVLFLSHLEQDPETLLRYNTLFVINRDGMIIGRHRKINTLPGSESWSVPGESPTIVTVDGVSIGLMICADAWPPDHAKILKNKGAEILLSTANWAPGLYGPGDSWEQRVKETGLALFVNNRTGAEDDLDMTSAVSVLVTPSPSGAERIFEYHSEDDTIILLDYQRTEKALSGYQVVTF